MGRDAKSLARVMHTSKHKPVMLDFLFDKKFWLTVFRSVRYSLLVEDTNLRRQMCAIFEGAIFVELSLFSRFFVTENSTLNIEN